MRWTIMISIIEATKYELIIDLSDLSNLTEIKIYGISRNFILFTDYRGYSVKYDYQLNDTRLTITYSPLKQGVYIIVFFPTHKPPCRFYISMGNYYGKISTEDPTQSSRDSTDVSDIDTDSTDTGILCNTSPILPLIKDAPDEVIPLFDKNKAPTDSLRFSIGNLVVDNYNISIENTDGFCITRSCNIIDKVLIITVNLQPKTTYKISSFIGKPTFFTIVTS